MKIFGKEAVKVGGLGIATAIDNFLDGKIAVGQQDMGFLQL